MAQQVKSVIEIEGKELEAVSSISVVQRLNWHHDFEIHARFQNVEGKINSMLEESRKFVGKSIKITLTTVILGQGASSKEMIYKGVITQVGFSRFKGSLGSVIISGKSPTIFLDGSKHSGIFNNLKIGSIAAEICNKYPDLKIKDSTSANGTIGYLVQFRESDYHFLKRIYQRYGDWMYYDGEQIQFGKSPGKTVELVLGSNLTSLNFASRLIPTQQNVFERDYLTQHDKGTLLKPKKPKGPKGNPVGDFMLTKGQSFFDKNASIPGYHFAGKGSEQGETDWQNLLDVSVETQSSGITVISGVSDHPEVSVGKIIDIKAKEAGETFDYGKYLVINVNHSSQGQNNYQNNFEAIPESQVAPPICERVSPPFCDAMPAIVVDTADPEKIGRIRVKFYWDKQGLSPWIRWMTPYAGKGKGIYFAPEVDDEVIVGFELGNPDYPYVLGSLWNGKSAFKSASSATGGVKALHSSAGNEIRFLDKKDAQQIIISNAGSEAFNKITMSVEDEKIILETQGDMEFTAAGNMLFTAGGNVNMSIGGNTTSEIGGNLDETIGGNVGEKVGGDKNVQTSGKHEVIAGTDGKMEAGSNLEINAGGNADLVGGGNIKVEGGANVKVTAGAKASVEGAAGFEGKTAAIAVIKGSLVQIN